jgi:hypothetical protein
MGSLTRVDAMMEEWNLEATPLVAAELADPTSELHEAIYNDWSIVDDLSEVDVERFDVTLGARVRGQSGWGFELAGTFTNYQDNAPILEDETGQYLSLSTLVSRSF